MAIEDEGEAVVARIVGLIRMGVLMTEALQREGCVIWFYRKASPEQKAEILRAKGEVDQLNLLEEMTGIGSIRTKVAIDKKRKFQELCLREGCSVSGRVAMLITADLNQNYNKVA